MEETTPLQRIILRLNFGVKQLPIIMQYEVVSTYEFVGKNPSKATRSYF